MRIEFKNAIQRLTLQCVCVCGRGVGGCGRWVWSMDLTVNKVYAVEHET